MKSLLSSIAVVALFLVVVFLAKWMFKEAFKPYDVSPLVWIFGALALAFIFFRAGYKGYRDYKNGEDKQNS